MTPQMYVETQITPKLAPLSDIDERTNKFFQKLMEPINLSLNAIPSVSNGFAMLASFTNDPEIRDKVVKGVAFPFIKELMIDLDNIKTSIVDDMINC